MEAQSKVLLLDDDLDLQELIVERLAPKGLAFTVFADPSEPLALLKDDPNYLAQFNLIITDFRMPHVDGVEFIKQIRKASQTTPILLMTTAKHVEVAAQAIRAGAYDFIIKPINFPQLNVAIDRALDLKRLRSQNEILRSTIRSHGSFFGIVGKSQAIQAVFDVARRVANSSANILIAGESGTGKEVVAKAIHKQGARSKAPFVAINCSAIPETLLESELFGHAKGSFTGAHEKKVGIFEEAHGGTLFLDEIGDLNLPLQAKLLRVLQERKIKRIGENTERNVDVRVITATHKDLKKEVAEKRFREDLFFRLNVIQIRIPPLRERREDIIPLAEHFFEKYAAQNDCTAKGFSKTALEYLLQQPWPGNVRELENTVERAVVLSQNPLIEASDFAQDFSLMEPARHTLPAVAEEADDEVTVKHILMKAKTKIPTLEEFSQLYVAYVMTQCGGVKEQAARALEIDRKTLYRKLLELEKQQSPPLKDEAARPAEG